MLTRRGRVYSGGLLSTGYVLTTSTRVGYTHSGLKNVCASMRVRVLNARAAWAWVHCDARRTRGA